MALTMGERESMIQLGSSRLIGTRRHRGVQGRTLQSLLPSSHPQANHCTESETLSTEDRETGSPATMGGGQKCSGGYHGMGSGTDPDGQAGGATETDCRGGQADRNQSDLTSRVLERAACQADAWSPSGVSETL